MERAHSTSACVDRAIALKEIEVIQALARGTREHAFEDVLVNTRQQEDWLFSIQPVSYRVHSRSGSSPHYGRPPHNY